MVSVRSKVNYAADRSGLGVNGGGGGGGCVCVWEGGGGVVKLKEEGHIKRKVCFCLLNLETTNRYKFDILLYW